MRVAFTASKRPRRANIDEVPKFSFDIFLKYNPTIKRTGKVVDPNAINLDDGFKTPSKSDNINKVKNMTKHV